MNASPYELLIFDWDGTLADSAGPIVSSMQGAIRELGLPARTDDAIRDLIGLGLRDVMNRLYPDEDADDLLRLLEGYRVRFIAGGHNEAPLFAGALEALTMLRGMGFRLAVATGKSRPGLNRSLTHHKELAALVEATRTADETRCKPDPLMVEELLWETGVEPQRAMVIGDTEYDVFMASGARVPALGVACGVHEPQRLLSAGAVDLLEMVRDLPAWLRKNAEQ
jgi:phosphoglycolate phosphatase